MEVVSLTSKYTAYETVEALIALEDITKMAEEVTRQTRGCTQHALVGEVNLHPIIYLDQNVTSNTENKKYTLHRAIYFNYPIEFFFCLRIE